ncbi:hypothetical protein ACRXB1_25550, partial [Caballeronia sp. M23-90]
MLPAQKLILETLLTDAVKQVVQASQGASEANFVTPATVIENYPRAETNKHITGSRISMLPAQKLILETLLTDAVKQVVQA